MPICQKYILFFLLVPTHLYNTSNETFHETVNCTEKMFNWINTFMDKKNPLPYRKSVQELEELIPRFSYLASSTRTSSDELDEHLNKIVTQHLKKLKKIHAILANPKAQKMSSLRLGLQLFHVCHIPTLVKDLKTNLIELEQTTKKHRAHALPIFYEFYTDSFEPFYKKWHNKSPYFFLSSLRYRLSCHP